MADHSQKWHDGSLSQSVCGSNNFEVMAAIVSKLDNLGPRYEKIMVKDVLHQVSCPLNSEDGPHLDKECPLNEDAKTNSNKQLTKEVYVKAATEVPSSSVGQCKAVYDDAPINKHSLMELMKSVECLSLMSRKMMIFRLKFCWGVMADLGASINVTPKSMFEHLKLDNLKETNMLVEMADMTKKDPLGIIENILVKIDKFVFSSDFMIIHILETRNETMILGRPFLATIHAEIDIFNKEISLGIGNDRIIFDMNKKSYKFTTPVEKAYMVNVVYNNDLLDIDCDLFLYECASCEYNRLLTIDPDFFTYDIDI
ncbi:putative reverse transcriptase domain-containing protein [Tanacetum coccineum]